MNVDTFYIAGLYYYYYFKIIIIYLLRVRICFIFYF